MDASMPNNKKRNKLKGGEFKVPHTLVIITAIIFLIAIATYIVPGGAYDEAVNEAGKTVVVDGSFHYIENKPQGLFEVLQAPIQGIVDSAEIIAFLFIVGGAFNIISRTKAIDFGIVNIVNVFKGKEILIIPIITTIFSLGGAIFGMYEESVPFVAILVPLMLALGYDSILAIAVTYLACAIGFSSAMLNPFTVGIAQSIAEIPMFSGIEYRTTIWAITTVDGCAFFMIYARRIKKNPKLSPVYESDQIKRENLKNNNQEQDGLTLTHRLVLLSLALCIGI